jgi:GST-like protein
MRPITPSRRIVSSSSAFRMRRWTQNGTCNHIRVVMHKLFGYKGSGSAAIECALELANVRYQVINAASWAPDSSRDELARINPLQQVPSIVLPDGTVLSESAAILIHLGLQYPAAGLLPVAPSHRARAIRGLVYIAANCYSAVSVSDFPERWLESPTEDARHNLKAGSRSRLHAHWDIFADSFVPDPYLSGAEPGALDLLASVVSRWSGSREHLRQSRPALAHCLAEVEKHALVKSVFSRHWDI